MKNETQIANEILAQFKKPKIICGIKNEDIKIELKYSYLWWTLTFLFIPMVAMIPIFITNMIEIYKWSLLITSLLFIGISIIAYKSTNYIIYFENNELILKNGFGRKNVIDISKRPKIYARYLREKVKTYNHTRDRLEDGIRISYKLYIEQGDTEIVFDIWERGNEQYNLLLDNLLFQEKEEVSEEIWNTSISERERKYLSYIDYLKSKEKIIGIKDNKSKKIEREDHKIIITFKILMAIALLMCLSGTVGLMIIKEFSIAIWIILLTIVIMCALRYKEKSLYLNISYPRDGVIEINEYTFYYKRSNIKLNMKKYEAKRSQEKDYYVLEFICYPKTFAIELKDAKAEEIGEFIDNFIFKEKEN